MKLPPVVEFHVKKTSTLGVEILDIDYFKDPGNHPIEHDIEAPHRLAFHIIIFICGGKSANHLIDFEWYALKPGEFLVLGTDQIQSMKETIQNCQGYMLLFTEAFLLELSATFPALATHYNNYNFHPVCRPSKNVFNHLIWLLKHSKELLDNSPDQLQGEAARAYIKVVLLKIFEHRQFANKDLSANPHLNSFMEFQSLVRKSMHKEHSVKYFSAKMNLSQKKLNQVVKCVVHQTAKDYIISQIVLEAKRLLKSSKLSIAEIAYKLGFEETTNFTKFFKKHADMLPSQFAKSA